MATKNGWTTAKRGAMTNQQILRQLLDVLKINVSHSGGSILTSDLVHQEALYTFQEEMTAFLARLGNATPGGPDLLEKEFPQLFKAR